MVAVLRGGAAISSGSPSDSISSSFSFLVHRLKMINADIQFIANQYNHGIQIDEKHQDQYRADRTIYLIVTSEFIDPG